MVFQMQDGRGNDHRGKRDKDRLKKAYKIALESLEADDTSSGDDSVATSPRAKLVATSNDDGEDETVDSLAAHAARMYSSLKD